MSGVSSNVGKLSGRRHWEKERVNLVTYSVLILMSYSDNGVMAA
jgi:hypothetical protein